MRHNLSDTSELWRCRNSSLKKFTAQVRCATGPYAPCRDEVQLNNTMPACAAFAPSPSRSVLRPKCATLPFSRLLCSIANPDSAQHHAPPSRERRAVLAAAALALLNCLPAGSTFAQQVASAYDVVAQKNGAPFSLNAFAGKVTLFVNVASYCALTPQYEALVSIHDELKPAGFEIVASPCDQFGHQEPASNEEVCSFAKKKFGAKFLLLDKLNVNDAPGGVAPLYKFLKDTSPEGRGERVGWNFEKFLVGVDGRVLRRYKPSILPEQIKPDVQWALKHPGEPLPPKPKVQLGV